VLFYLYAWGHEPWIYISCVAVAFVITNVGLIFIILKAAKQMQKVVDESKEQKK